MKLRLYRQTDMLQQAPGIFGENQQDQSEEQHQEHVEDEGFKFSKNQCR